MDTGMRALALGILALLGVLLWGRGSIAPTGVSRSGVPGVAEPEQNDAVALAPLSPPADRSPVEAPDAASTAAPVTENSTAVTPP